ncbi:type IV pilus modification protein PilV [Spartinivicinus ruber]|uniref:type IV pilus modification protein PilV n=1 Tax=Spartinivicinus ruber TaxID=2683272 RepID=UPI0013D85F8A|nr:type IV pilus modification protein PilV [Spartinivicinus ruber]
MQINQYTNQQGIGLIEVLITILIIAIGLLGLAGMQAQSIKSTYQASQRSQAIWLAQELVERMRANPLGIINNAAGGYTKTNSFSCSSKPKNCNGRSASCTHNEIAQHDLWNIFCDEATNKEILANLTPTITCAPTDCSPNADITVTVEWEEASGKFSRQGNNNPRVELLVKIEG